MIGARLALLAGCALAAGLLASCGKPAGPAPLQVVDIEQVPSVLPNADGPVRRPQVHVVQQGETLGEIALAYGLDYRELALWNNLTNPDLIEIGQQLRLAARKGQAKVIPLQPALVQKPAATGTDGQPAAGSGVTRTRVGVGAAPAADRSRRVSIPQAVKLPYTAANLERLNNRYRDGVQQASLQAPASAVPANSREQQGIDWSWPVKGRLTSTFSDTNPGIDIVGPRGQPVFASADGKVIYAGTGLTGYGQLVIIKHANEYLTTYAHNDRILVAEGETVQRGKQIAEMGDSGTDRVRLHFAIRRGKDTFDPQQFLPKNP